MNPERSQHSGYEPRETTEYRDPDDGDSIDAAALDEVLQATAASMESSDKLTQRELDALMAVANRWGNTALSLDPIAIDLVEAMITANYSNLRRSPASWRRMATRIATLLYESPATNPRLANLWRRLNEANQ